MFDISLIDAGLLPAITIALIAGIFSFLSPCVLPIVPPYLASMGGVSINDMSSEATSRSRAVVAAPPPRLCVSSANTPMPVVRSTSWTAAMALM